MDTVSEARLAQVMPTLADKVRQLAATLAAENVFLRVTQGLRTWDEQDALYAQGRTTAGQRVTNAKGGQSWHNFGCAVDLVPDCADAPEGKFIPDWNSSHPAWKRMIEVGTSLGLTSGATWRSRPDEPHFQLTGRFPENCPDHETIDIYQGGGLEAVWDEINKPT